jgi:hypothetical protein
LWGLTFGLLAGAFYAWQLTLILVLVGGFVGHGWGAVIALVISGLIGGIAYENRHTL